MNFHSRMKQGDTRNDRYISYNDSNTQYKNYRKTRQRMIKNHTHIMNRTRWAIICLFRNRTLECKMICLQYSLTAYLLYLSMNYVITDCSVLKYGISQPHYSNKVMTSSNGNIFRVTGPLCGEFTGHRWIRRKKARDAELWCFLWFVPEQTVQ